MARPRLSSRSLAVGSGVTTYDRVRRSRPPPARARLPRAASACVQCSVDSSPAQLVAFDHRRRALLIYSRATRSILRLQPKITKHPPSKIQLHSKARANDLYDSAVSDGGDRSECRRRVAHQAPDEPRQRQRQGPRRRARREVAQAPQEQLLQEGVGGEQPRAGHPQLQDLGARRRRRLHGRRSCRAAAGAVARRPPHPRRQAGAAGPRPPEPPRRRRRRRPEPAAGAARRHALAAARRGRHHGAEDVQGPPHAPEPRRLRHRGGGAVVEALRPGVAGPQVRLLLRGRQAGDGGVPLGQGRQAHRQGRQGTLQGRQGAAAGAPPLAGSDRPAASLRPQPPPLLRHLVPKLQHRAILLLAGHWSREGDPSPELPEEQAQLAARHVPRNERARRLRSGRGGREAGVPAERPPREHHRRVQVDLRAQHQQVALRGPEEEGPVPALQLPGRRRDVRRREAHRQGRRPQGHLALQRPLPPHRGELQRVHQLPAGAPRRPNRRQEMLGGRRRVPVAEAEADLGRGGGVAAGRRAQRDGGGPGRDGGDGGGRGCRGSAAGGSGRDQRPRAGEVDERRRRAHRVRPGLPGGAAEPGAGAGEPVSQQVLGGAAAAAVADPVAAPEPADHDVAAGAVHGLGREPRRAAGEAAVPGHPGAHGAPHAAQQQDQQELINRRSITEYRN